MKVLFTLVTFLALTIVITSCTVSECEKKLTRDYSEIDDYIASENLANYSEVLCNTETLDHHTFNGYQEPEGKCHFIDVSLEVGKTNITTFTFLIDGSRQYDILVYEFENTDDLEKLKQFIPDASLYLEKNKEIHEFFEGDDKVYLYYFGFP